MSCKITAANVDDRSPLAKLMQRLQGWLFVDNGYFCNYKNYFLC